MPEPLQDISASDSGCLGHQESETMDTRILIAMAVSFALGSLSYIIIQFWIRPIARYRKIRQEVAQALSACEADEIFSEEAAGTIRKYSVGLSDAYTLELPHWYRMLLDSRKESPVEASRELMTLAGTREREYILKRIAGIRQVLLL